MPKDQPSPVSEPALTVPMMEGWVDVTAGIDRWCSGPDWVLPSHEAFGSGAEPVTFACGYGVALLSRYRTTEGIILAGREPMWGFACPVLTDNPQQFVPEFGRWLNEDDHWNRAILPGFPADFDYARQIGLGLVEAGVAKTDGVGAAEGIVRQVADLSGGFEPWWDRRSASFRKNLRNAQRRAVAAGVSFVEVTDQDGLLDRFVAIEEQSWKGADRSGITAPEMQTFYRSVIGRLQAAGRLRAAVAQRDGKDVGYIFGGVRGGIYRGLQLSYTQEVAELSVSHLLQLREVEALCDLGVATYDMGMDMEYKGRFADSQPNSLVLVVDR